MWRTLSVLLFVTLLAVPARAAAAPVPIIVDTDMFSDADDAGALATAFGLQYRGEAQVLAVMVNTRNAGVNTHSWQCVAAITNFYGSGSIPLGTHMPNDANLADGGFAGGCADQNPDPPPTPTEAVQTYHDVLAAQPDHSVVIVSIGYLGNLSDLLDAHPDLVAQKVKRLVAMGGQYPSRTGTAETNFRWAPAAAQNVAQNWPTEIVWSGYEVGSGIWTGHTLSDVHPATSPVRKAYEDFTQTTGEDLQSWDLATVYYAVRPADDLFTVSAKGTNVVDGASGLNAFTVGAGNQCYITMKTRSPLAPKIETLLDTLQPLQAPADPGPSTGCPQPPPPPPPPPPPRLRRRRTRPRRPIPRRRPRAPRRRRRPRRRPRRARPRRRRPSRRRPPTRPCRPRSRFPGRAAWSRRCAARRSPPHAHCCAGATARSAA